MVFTASPAAAAASLLCAAAVRARCRLVFELGRQDALRHFRLRLDQLEACALFVLDTVRAAYPTLAIPHHSRWLHFGAGGRDRWATLEPRVAGDSMEAKRERLRTQFDLVITSVLLDAGAGKRWRYREAGGGEYARSEGLAVASFHLFAAGVLAADRRSPLRADASALAGLDESQLAAAFQV